MLSALEVTMADKEVNDLVDAEMTNRQAAAEAELEMRRELEAKADRRWYALWCRMNAVEGNKRDLGHSLICEVAKQSHIQIGEPKSGELRSQLVLDALRSIRNVERALDLLHQMHRALDQEGISMKGMQRDAQAESSVREPSQPDGSNEPQSDQVNSGQDRNRGNSRGQQSQRGGNSRGHDHRRGNGYSHDDRGRGNNGGRRRQASYRPQFDDDTDSADSRTRLH